MSETDHENVVLQPPRPFGDEGEKDASARIKAPQRLRLQRAALAVANYAVIGFYTLYLYLSGQLTLYPTAVVLIYLAVVVAYCVFFWLIASGRNLRFQEPSLTRPQLMLAAGLTILMFNASRTSFSQGLYFFSFLIFLMFGAFRLNLKQLMVTELPAFGCFAVLLIVRHDYFGETLGGSVAHAAVYLVLTGWMIFFAAYISRLRLVLSARNKAFKQAVGRINELAVKDELTGAYNRRFILCALEREIERAKRSGEPFSVCLLDIDHFKEINDGHGHLVGDAVLCELVKRVSAQQLEADGVVAIIHTDISRDGMMQGLNVEATRALATELTIPVIASGGVTDMADIDALLATEADSVASAIIGHAIYEGTLDLAAARKHVNARKGG